MALRLLVVPMGVMLMGGCGAPSPVSSCSRQVNVERYKDDLVVIRPAPDPVIGCGDRARAAGLECPPSCPDELPLSETFYAFGATEIYSRVLVPFVMTERPITNGQVAECIGAGECFLAGLGLLRDEQPWMDPAVSEEVFQGDGNTTEGGYCYWRGLHVCTEAEWEIAARGRSSYLFAWGDSSADECRAITGESLEGFLLREDVSEFGVRGFHSHAAHVVGTFADYRTACVIGEHAAQEGEGYQCGTGQPGVPCCHRGPAPYRGGLHPLYFRDDSTSKLPSKKAFYCCEPLRE